jgi:RNA polymerase sigma-70 factor (ECF subfamily)
VDARGALKITHTLESMESGEVSFDFEAFFHAHYARVTRAVARVTGDSARSEDLAAEALWKLWRTPKVLGDSAVGWLYRTALRLGLNELRGRARRGRYESLSHSGESVSTPEEVHAAAEKRGHVRAVLADLDARDAELLILRASGIGYSEIAEALEINPASVGTLIARAQRAFRKEYVSRYGDQSNGR